MKSKIFKGLVLASALAFMNCGDDSVNAVRDQLGDQGVPGVENPDQPANPDMGNPEDPALPGGEMDIPATPGEETPDPPSESSPSEVAPESSSEVVPESSSSVDDPAESSSSEEVVVPSEPGVYLSEGTDENKDYFGVEVMENVGPDGGGILAYPKPMSTDPNKKHAVVIWGPGGGEKPGRYMGIISRLASHGFVVFALSESPGNASKAIAAIDWLEEKNNLDYGVLSGKLDMNNVGCSGHSMGGLESEQTLIKDKRVRTAMLNNSGDLDHIAMTQVATDKTIGIVYGEGGMERPNAEADYNNAGVRAPACLIKMSGGQGSECQQGECGWGHGSGPWGGMAATVAWMRWHLGAEDFRKADFVGTNGRYIDGEIVGQQGHWKGQCKNF